MKNKPEFKTQFDSYTCAGDTIEGALPDAEDSVDYFRISVPGAGRVYVKLDNSAHRKHYWVYLYDSNGDSVGTRDDDPDDRLRQLLGHRAGPW